MAQLLRRRDGAAKTQVAFQWSLTPGETILARWIRTNSIDYFLEHPHTRQAGKDVKSRIDLCKTPQRLRPAVNSR